LLTFYRPHLALPDGKSEQMKDLSQDLRQMPCPESLYWWRQPFPIVAAFSSRSVSEFRACGDVYIRMMCKLPRGRRFVAGATQMVERPRSLHGGRLARVCTGRKGQEDKARGSGDPPCRG